MFEKVFFSAETKRVDLCLTSETHKEQNATCMAKNADHEVFKGVNRLVQTMDAFKENVNYHPDFIKDNWSKK